MFRMKTICPIGFYAWITQEMYGQTEKKGNKTKFDRDLT